jgi:hypothetical protein
VPSFLNGSKKIDLHDILAVLHGGRLDPVQSIECELVQIANPFAVHLDRSEWSNPVTKKALFNFLQHKTG